jgi:pimeloyl-ACP methyl ester carboxylesterase
VFEDSGHYPQLDDPERFSTLLSHFIATTEPAEYDTALLRERLLAGAAS